MSEIYTLIFYERDTGRVVSTIDHPQPKGWEAAADKALARNAALAWIRHPGRLSKPLARRVVDGVVIEAAIAAPTLDDLIAAARAQRDRRLAASDWTQIADNRLDADARAAWAVYRAETRAAVDRVKAGGDAHWPSPPSA